MLGLHKTFYDSIMSDGKGSPNLEKEGNFHILTQTHTSQNMAILLE